MEESLIVDKWWQDLVSFYIVHSILYTCNRSSWSRGSVPSSHTRGQRFEPRRRQYFKLLLDPGDFSLQPQRNPYPTSTPPSCWVRHVRSIGGPQYGLAVCHHSRRSGRRPQQQNPTWEWRQHSWAEFPMMVIHHTHHLFSSFQHSSLDGAQVVVADAAQRPTRMPSTTYIQHSIFRSPDR